MPSATAGTRSILGRRIIRVQIHPVAIHPTKRKTCLGTGTGSSNSLKPLHVFCPRSGHPNTRRRGDEGDEEIEAMFGCSDRAHETHKTRQPLSTSRRRSDPDTVDDGPRDHDITDVRPRRRRRSRRSRHRRSTRLLGRRIALAWTIRNGKVIAIPESGSAAHVKENAVALALTLTPDQLEALDAAHPPPGR